MVTSKKKKNDQNLPVPIGIVNITKEGENE